jgi:hypothetical protein
MNVVCSASDYNPVSRSDDLVPLGKALLRRGIAWPIDPTAQRRTFAMYGVNRAARAGEADFSGVEPGGSVSAESNRRANDCRDGQARATQRQIDRESQSAADIDAWRARSSYT